jgi:hypothetical protein
MDEIQKSDSSQLSSDVYEYFVTFAVFELEERLSFQFSGLESRCGHRNFSSIIHEFKIV